MTMVSALRSSGAAASTSSGESKSFAPFTTMMRFWPPGSTKTRGDRLIGSFAAKTKVKFLAEDRLARPRKHVIERGEIHVGAAHHGNEGLLGHRFASDDSARGLYRNSIRKLQQLSPASTMERPCNPQLCP